MESVELYQKLVELKKHGSLGSLVIDENGKIFLSDAEKFTPTPFLAMMCQASLEAGEKVCKALNMEAPESILCMHGKGERVLIRKAGKMIFVCMYDAKNTKPEFFDEVESIVRGMSEG